MSVKVVDWLFHRRGDVKLSSGALLVGIALAEHASAENGITYPKVKTIADMCGLGTRVVQSHLKALVAAGVIEVVERSHRYDATMYRFVAFAAGDDPEITFRKSERATARARIRHELEFTPEHDVRGELQRASGVNYSAFEPVDTSNEPSREPSLLSVRAQAKDEQTEHGGFGPVEADFVARFWSRWPRGRGSRWKSLEQWRRMSAADRTACAERLPAFLACWNWRKESGRFVKHAERWLRDRGWEDDVPPDVPASGTNGAPDPSHRPAIKPATEILYAQPKSLSPELLDEFRQFRHRD